MITSVGSDLRFAMYEGAYGRFAYLIQGHCGQGWLEAALAIRTMAMPFVSQVQKEA